MHLTTIIGLAGTCMVTAFSGNHTTTDFNNLTVALVRAPPANWPLALMNKNWTGVKFDLNNTVDKGVDLIKVAAQNGANLIVFPELWFPGYPKGMADNVSIVHHIENYFENSLEVDSPQWNRLVSAAVSHQVYISPAFSHRQGDSIYMGQALISPKGEVMHFRHKLRPSGGEREIWSDGTIDGLKVIATPYGRWGVLECWEQFHPAMTFNMQAQAETLHLASFPYTPDEGDLEAAYCAEINMAAARTYAVNAGAPFAFATVGNSRFLDSQGLDITVVKASASFDTVPLVYVSFDTASLAQTVPYATDGEQSWGILQLINAGFPSYILKVRGNYVQRHIVSTSKLIAG